MKRILQIFLMLFAVSLCSCTDPADVERRNIEHVINSVISLDKVYVMAPGTEFNEESSTLLLIEDPSLEENSSRKYAYPKRVYLNRQVQIAKAMESTGLLTLTKSPLTYYEKDGTVRTTFGWKAYVRDSYRGGIVRFQNGGMAFIAGVVGVEKIHQIVGPEIVGNMESVMVVYTRTVIDRPKWVNDEILNDSGAMKLLEGMQTIRLVRLKDDKKWYIDSKGFQGVKIS